MLNETFQQYLGGLQGLIARLQRDDGTASMAAPLAALRDEVAASAEALTQAYELFNTQLDRAAQLKQQVTAQFAGHPDQESLAIHAQQLWQQLGALLSAVEQSRINRPVQPIPPY